MTCRIGFSFGDLCWEKEILGYTKPQKESKKEERKSQEERGIGSSLLILDLNNGKLLDAEKQEEGKKFHELHVLGVNDDMWNKVRELGSKNWRVRMSRTSSGSNTPQRNNNYIADLLRAMPVKANIKYVRIFKWDL